MQGYRLINFFFSFLFLTNLSLSLVTKKHSKLKKENTKKKTGRQTDRETEKETETVRRTDTGGQADRQTDRRTDIQTEIWSPPTTSLASFLANYWVRFQYKRHNPGGPLESSRAAVCRTWPARSGFRAADFGPRRIFVSSVKSGEQGQRVRVYDQGVNSLINYCQSETDLWVISHPN